MLDDLTKLVLANAVYFKGQWKDKFDLKLTRNMPFHTSKVEVKDVLTMYRQGKYKYGDLVDLNAKFVVIPYKVSLGEKVNNVLKKSCFFVKLCEVQKKKANKSSRVTN